MDDIRPSDVMGRVVKPKFHLLIDLQSDGLLACSLIYKDHSGTVMFRGMWVDTLFKGDVVIPVLEAIKVLDPGIKVVTSQPEHEAEIQKVWRETIILNANLPTIREAMNAIKEKEEANP